MKVRVHKSVQVEVDTSSSAHGDKRLIHTWHTHVFPITRLCSQVSQFRRGQPDQEIRCQLHLNYIQILIQIKTLEPEFNTHGTLDRVVTHSLRTYLDLLFQNKVAGNTEIYS